MVTIREIEPFGVPAVVAAELTVEARAWELLRSAARRHDMNLWTSISTSNLYALLNALVLDLQEDGMLR